MVNVSNPAELGTTFAKAFNDRALEELLSLYEPNAILLVYAETWTGHQEIRTALEQVLNLPGTMSLQVNFCTVNGDLATMRSDWIVRDGEAVIMSGSSVELARRQADGSWRYVIDNATGAGIPSVPPLG